MIYPAEYKNTRFPRTLREVGASDEGFEVPYNYVALCWFSIGVAVGVVACVAIALSR